VKHEDVSAFLCESRQKFAKCSLELEIPQPLLGQTNETQSDVIECNWLNGCSFIA